MGSAGLQRRALLLGLVEVMRPVKQLGQEARARVVAMCHKASTAGHVEDPGWLGWLERGFMGVEVIVDQQHLHVTSDEVLVSRHSLAEVGAIMTVQRPEGHVVFIGHCQVKGLRLAVVLDMMEELSAQQLENDVRQRLSRSVPLSARLSAPQDIKSPGQMSGALYSTPASDSEQDPSTSHPHTPGSSASHHSNGEPEHSPPSQARPGTLPLHGMARSVFRISGLTGPPPLPAKPVLPRAPAAIAPPREKPPLANRPTAAMLTATPLCLISRPGASLVATRPVLTSLASTSAVTTPPAVVPSVSSPLVVRPPVTTRPMSSRVTSQTSTTTVITRPVSTPLVSSPKVCIPIVSTKTVSTPTVSMRPVSTPTVSTLTLSTRNASIPKVSTRPLSFPKAFTSLVSIPPVSTPPVYTSTVSTSSVSTPKVSTRPVSTPKVSTRPVSTPKVFTPLVSIPTVSATSVSTLAESMSTVPTTPVSTSTVSTNSKTTSTVSITLASTVAVTSLTETSSAVPPVSTRSSSVLERRSSIVSSSSQEEESKVNEKVELLLGALNMDESEYLYISGLQPPREKDSSFSLEQELCTFLENERQYLNTLERIKEARKVLTEELQNLLRGSDRLADFHEDMYRDLYQEFPSSHGIAQVFLSRMKELDQYRYLIMNAPQVASQLRQQTEEVVSQHPTLEADIKASWKRVHFYFMTFERLVKIVPAEEQQLVQKVVDLLRETNRQGDSGILIDAVTEAPFSLHTLGTLLLHSLFTIKDSSGMLSSRIKYHVLLFEEMMVIALPKKEKYHYKDHLPLRQLNVLPQPNSDEPTFILELVQGGNKRNRKYTFRPRQQEAKEVWVAEIGRLHLKYEEEVERLRQLRLGY